MDKARQSSGSFLQRLETLRVMLGELEAEYQRSQPAEPEAAEPENTATADPLIAALRDVGGLIGQHLCTQRQQLDAVDGRVRALEQVIHQMDRERALLAQRLGRTDGQQSAREPTLMKAPRPTPAADYLPVLTAALQVVRDLGACWIQRTGSQQATTQSKGT
ncbi:MAG: hypothetical protein U1A78_15275 [Polyangia bacterium]